MASLKLHHYTSTVIHKAMRSIYTKTSIQKRTKRWAQPVRTSTLAKQRECHAHTQAMDPSPWPAPQYLICCFDSSLPILIYTWPHLMPLIHSKVYGHRKVAVFSLSYPNHPFWSNKKGPSLLAQALLHLPSLLHGSNWSIIAWPSPIPIYLIYFHNIPHFSPDVEALCSSKISGTKPTSSTQKQDHHWSLKSVKHVNCTQKPIHWYVKH